MTRRIKEVLIAVVVGALLTLGSIAVFGALSGSNRTPTLTFASCEPHNVKGSQVQVRLTDGGGMMGGGTMMLSLSADRQTVPAGEVTFIATNYGQLNHELLILPAPADGPGTRPVDTSGKIDEASSLGEASRSCGSGAGNGISPGTRSWITVDLQPGTYELLCDQPWHYADGMFNTIGVIGVP